MRINVEQFYVMMETEVKKYSDMEMVKVLLGIEESDMAQAFKTAMANIVKTEMTLRKYGKSKQKIA